MKSEEQLPYTADEFLAMKQEKIDALIEKIQQYETKWWEICERWDFDQIWWHRKSLKIHYRLDDSRWKIMDSTFRDYDRMMEIITTINDIEYQLGQLGMVRK